MTPRTSPSTAYAVFLVAFLTLLNIVNFVDRQLIASLAPKLMADLKLSKTDIGWLTGYAFIVFYTAMGLVLGIIADRFHRPRLIALGVALWSALTGASGMARNFVQLASARMLVGVGEATLSPASLSMLADAFPPARRALVSGIYYAGVPLGAGISLLVVWWMEPRYGWRSCFYLLGVLGIVLALIVLLLREIPRGGQGTAVAAPVERPSAGEIFRTLGTVVRTSPALVLTTLGGICLTFQGGSMNLSVAWLVNERGMKFTDAVLYGGLIYLVAGVTGNFFGGWFGDFCQRRGKAGKLWSLVIGSFLFTPLGIAFLLLPPKSWLWYVSWFFASMGSTYWYGPLFAIAQDLSPVKIRATVVAAFILAVNCFGTGAGPLAVGMIGDKRSLTAGLFLAVIVGFLSCVPFSLAARRYGDDVQKVA